MSFALMSALNRLANPARSRASSNVNGGSAEAAATKANVPS